jgi:hypothetical protein
MERKKEKKIMTAFDIHITHQYQQHSYTILPALTDDKKNSIFYVFEDENQVATLQLFDIVNWVDITYSIDEDLVEKIANQIESYYK